MSDCPDCHGNDYYEKDGKFITCHCVPFDPVHKPSHYTNGGDEPINFIFSWDMGYHEGNIVKYIVRWENKGGVQDLEKCAWYVNDLIRKTKRNGG